MELHEALTQIAEIRQQMARTETFRGYRSVTTAFSGVVALVASWVQSEFYFSGIKGDLWLWLAAAALSLAVVAAEIVIRYRRSPSALQREITLVAVEQFVPCLVAGGLMTYVLFHFATSHNYYAIGLLPGLWAILFSLGVFASRRVLPRGTFLVGGYYMLAGLFCLGQSETMSFAAQMATAFGGGQLFAAVVLYCLLERERRL